LLLRGEEGECDPAFASKEDRDVALPFSDLGLCLGSCTCNPWNQEPWKNRWRSFTDDWAKEALIILVKNDFGELRSGINNDVIGRNNAETIVQLKSWISDSLWRNNLPNDNYRDASINSSSSSVDMFYEWPATVGVNNNLYTSISERPNMAVYMASHC